MTLMKNMKPTDKAYMAGIFDGEGWFVLSPKENQMSANIAMVDYDIIHRLHEKAGIGRLSERIFDHKQNQLYWIIAVQEELEQFIHAVIPFLSIRRTERAKEVLAELEKRKEIREWRETHFICGHFKSEENTYHFRNSDKTSCRQCGRDSSKKRYEQKKKRTS